MSRVGPKQQQETGEMIRLNGNFNALIDQINAFHEYLQEIDPTVRAKDPSMADIRYTLTQRYEATRRNLEERQSQ